MPVLGSICARQHLYTLVELNARQAYSGLDDLPEGKADEAGYGECDTWY